MFISHSKNVVTRRKEKADESALIRTAQFVVWDSLLNFSAKLLQKSEMRKNMVMDLIYRGFIYAANYSESHYNPRRSQIKTPLRYLFVTMPENATNGYEWRNKALRYSELSTTHAKNPVTEKDCAVPLRFAYRHRTLHQLILKPKN